MKNLVIKFLKLKYVENVFKLLVSACVSPQSPFC